MAASFLELVPELPAVCSISTGEWLSFHSPPTGFGVNVGPPNPTYQLPSLKAQSFCFRISQQFIMECAGCCHILPVFSLALVLLLEGVLPADSSELSPPTGIALSKQTTLHMVTVGYPRSGTAYIPRLVDVKMQGPGPFSWVWTVIRGATSCKPPRGIRKSLYRNRIIVQHLPLLVMLPPPPHRYSRGPCLIGHLQANPCLSLFPGT